MPTNPARVRFAVDVWNELRREAHKISCEEPFLAQLVNQNLLCHNTFEEALTRLLAARLSTEDLPEETCRVLLSEVIRADQQIIEATAKDLMAVRTQDPACDTYSHAFLNYKGFQALQAHRFAHRLWRSGRQDAAVWLSNRASVVLGPDIHPAAQMGVGIMIDHGAGIVVGETAVVEDEVTILQNVTLGGTGKVAGDRHPKVRKGALIGAGANIIGNIEIGAFSIVGAGSVVLKDVPPYCTMAGAPAQIVRVHKDISQLADGSVGREISPGHHVA